jgi:DNA gyrase subunit A
MVVVRRNQATLLVVTEKGLGKCSPLDDYRVQKRGGKGILTVNRTEKTGNLVTLIEVLPEDEIMLITKQGQIIRSSVDQVRVTGRNAQGVKLVNPADGDLVCAVARVVPDDGVAEGVPVGDGDEPGPAGDEPAAE